MSKKQYKLIQWYPGIRTNIEEGTIFEEFNEKSYITKDYEVPYIVPRWEIENNPEFWEKVENRNFKILSLKGLNNGKVHDVINGKVHRYHGGAFGKNSWGENDPIKYITKYPKDWKIYSVKRLSDGEVFTVGDRVNSLFNTKFTIKGFEIDKQVEGGIKALVKDSEEPSLTSSSITVISHIKEPLFTTVDGVDIYEGDMYFEVRGQASHYSMFKAGCEAPHIEHTDITFSSREKAKEYIEEHKVRYSRHQIKEMLKKRAYHAWSTYRLDYDLEEYQQMVIDKCLEEINV